MRRREFIASIAGAAMTVPCTTRAQRSGAVYQIGFLGVWSLAEYRRLIEALRKGLSELGYEDGRNLLIHYRWAEGKYDRLASATGRGRRHDEARPSGPALRHLHPGLDRARSRAGVQL